MESRSVSRRSFLTSSLAGATAFQIVKPELVRGAGNEKLKAGLVGCGGRGTAAIQNVLTGTDNVEIVALGRRFRRPSGRLSPQVQSSQARSSPTASRSTPSTTSSASTPIRK